ncbi:MAG: penicillin acylase family protein, partial [Deltaproteobacteria bacterium]|nr:penicillin acylase family protein [Deltaproteobacteria bacterium]
VNAYAADVRAGKWTMDSDVLVSFDPERFVEWSPVDSLVLGRFQAFALSWTSPFEVDATELAQKLGTTYSDAIAADGAARMARKAIAADLLTFTPLGTEPTIDGFPNVDTDTGTRADGGRPNQRGTRTKPAGAVAASGSRPPVPQELFDGARSFFRKGIHTGAFGALGPHAFMHPYAGSNNWAVGPTLANGQALLATDQHLQLPNPSIFYPTHLTVAAHGDSPGVDVMGITFPGIPGVILGMNGKVAWSATVSYHDVNDIYLETIAPCGAGSCVTFNGAQVPIETFTEEIKIGALGTITGTKTVTYEVVPHHGPIIPRVANHDLVPRTGTSALSIRYTGYEPTLEIRALWNLARAGTVDEGFTALADFSYGSQNWTMIDVNRDIAWTTNAIVPHRDPRAYTWDVTARPDGLAPFFVLPGDGTAEWQGRMDSRYVPHAINPASGYLATANADPVGATFDGNPLDQPIVDGRPLYAGVTYAAGVREDRIATLIRETTATSPATLADMARIQHDSLSTIGERLSPVITTALARLDNVAGGPNDDVRTYLTNLGSVGTTQLTRARALLGAWTHAAPTALDAPSPQELTDSASTAIFNAWMHFFIINSIKDEFDAMSFDLWRLESNQIIRIIHAMLVHPETFAQSALTAQPILCDRIATAGDDSCTKVILESLVAAMAHLESAAGFGTAETTAWTWGTLHHLTIAPLFPNAALELPAPGETTLGGFAKRGDNFVVNRSDMGWADLDFAQFGDGPAQRFMAQTVTSGSETVLEAKWALPGGVIYDKRSPHYRDLLDNYYLAETHFDAPFTLVQIVTAGESRWDFH